MSTFEHPVSDKDRQNMPNGETWEEYLARRRHENAVTRQRHQQERSAARAAKQQQEDAAHQQRMQSLQDAYKVEAHAAFPGSIAEFETAWPQILADWQRRRVAEAEGQQQRALLASGRYHGF